MRWPAVAVLGTLSAGAFCQVPFTVVNDMAKVLKDNNYLHNGLPGFDQPDSEPGLAPKDEVPFLDFGQTGQFQIRHADSIDRPTDNLIVLEGNCLFLVRGYRITSDRAQYDKAAQTVTLIGHVHIQGDLFDVRDADSIEINFAKNTYVAKNGESQVSPQLVQGSLRDFAYVKGRESYGDIKQTVTLDGKLTTCNYPVPHYDIEARNIVLRPGRRVIFRKTKIRILGYVVATLPFLDIPLDDRTYKYTPYIGQNDIEGDFAKFLVGIPTKNPNYNIVTHEDFMSKLGIGLGVDYAYQSSKSAGIVSLYHVFGKTDDLTFSSTHKQIFNWGTITEQTDYQKDNYLVAPGTTTFNTRISALIPEGRSSDQITLTDASSSSYGLSNGTESLAIDDRRDFGNKLTSTTDITYQSSQSSFVSSVGSSASTTTNQQLNVNAQVQKDFNAATLALQYQRQIPIGTTSGYIGASNETPVITMTSDARRLLGQALGTEWPFQTTLSLGDFQDPVSKSDISRAYFDFAFNKVDTSQNKLKVDVNGDFHQGIYSDDTAQYVVGLGTNVRYDLGGTSGINLRYNYMRPFGYSPLSIDETGYTNYASGDLNYKPIQAVTLGAQTGYDFSRMQMSLPAWQQVSLRSEYQPTKYFLLRGLYTYDAIDSKWQDVRLDLTYIPGATHVAIGADYDAETHIWTSVNVNVDNFKWGNLKTSTALSYNGYLRMFDSEQFSFTYDLHCAEAVFTLQENNYGFNSGRQMAFFIRLKALPFDVPFGTGTRGQPIGVSSGSSF